MLQRQTLYILGNRRILAKFIARILVRLSSEQAMEPHLHQPRGRQSLNRAAGDGRIHLESAALMRHMNAVT